MQKVVIDTNVLVSSLIQKSFPYKIINELFIEGKIILCVSESLMMEYHEVLRRPKFASYNGFFTRAETLLADIETKAKMYFPQISLDILSDKDDNKILELADVCAADYIITGNTRDFTLQKYKNTIIVLPKDYWYIFYR
jgi:putative PIN family toxin of toxin-antitoxin system